MSTRPKRKPRPARCPVLVAMHVAPEVEITELQAIIAFRCGYAVERHYDILADCRDLLVLAANHKGAANVVAVCNLAAIALENIKARYLATQRNHMGCTGDELNAMGALVEVSQDWWKRQSGELFRAANEGLTLCRRHYLTEAKL